MKHKNTDTILIGMFCGFLAMMMIALFLLPKSTFSVEEKRVLAEKPPVSFKTVMDGSFEKGAERYVSDHFPGRKFFVGMDAYYSLYTGRNGSNGVYKGREGYLLRKPIEWQNENLDRNVFFIQKFAERIGKSVSVMVVPSSGFVEDDLLPWNHDVYRDEEMMQSIEFSLTQKQKGKTPVTAPNSMFSQNSVFWIDILSTFTEIASSQKNDSKLYYKTDHHWTSLGAYLAYVQAGSVLGYTPIPMADFDITVYDGFYGTSYARSAYWFTAPDQVEVWKYNGTNADDISVEISDDNQAENRIAETMFFQERLLEPDMYQVFLDGNHSLVKIVNHNAAQGKLLVVKDSYGHAITPFLANHFKEIYMVDLRYYRKSSVSKLIEENQIDQVFMVYSLDNLINDKNLVWLK